MTLTSIENDMPVHGAMNIPCPACLAPIGDECRDRLDGTKMLRAHRDRIVKAQAAIPYPPDELLRMSFPSVDEFAQLMRQELWANRRKGHRADWRKVSTWDFWVEVQYHAAKLAIAVKSNDKALIREHSADTANMLMMLADSAGLLDD